jgi:spoIIIJ-associated protein
MEWLEFEGETQEAAIAKALKALGAQAPDQIETQDVKVTRKFMGMGGRIYKIKARLKQNEPDQAQESAHKGESARDDHHSTREPERARKPKEPKETPPGSKTIESDVVTMESRYRPWVSEGPAGTVIPKKGKGFGRRIFNPDPLASVPRPTSHKTAPAKTAPAKTAVVEEEVFEEEESIVPVILEDVEGSLITEESRVEAVNFVAGVLADMGIKSEVKGYKLSDRLHIQIESDSGGLLIGRKGETLEALQYLTDLAINRKLETRIRIVLDTENYRDRKRHRVIDMAKEAAKDAVRTRRSVALPPMNPAERRIVHTALAGDTRLTTKSEGEGNRRRVVVHPAGAKAPSNKPSGGGGRGGFRGGERGGNDRGRPGGGSSRSSGSGDRGGRGGGRDRGR